MDGNHLDKGIGMGNLGPAGENCSGDKWGKLNLLKATISALEIWRFSNMINALSTKSPFHLSLVSTKAVLFLLS